MTNRRTAVREAARELVAGATETPSERHDAATEVPTQRHDDATATPQVRGATKTTPGGLLRRTLYFTPAEWAAVLEAAERTDRSAAGFVRHAVRLALERA